MNNMPLYQVLQAEKGNGNFTLAYILEGDFAGGQMLLRNGQPAWKTGPADLLQQHLDV